MPVTTNFTEFATRYHGDGPLPGQRERVHHYKFMCNLMLNGKRQTRNSSLSKSVVRACAMDKIHVSGAFGDNGEVFKCFHEAQAVQPGDMAHMYYGDLEKGTSKHFVGRVLSSYNPFSNGLTLDDFPEVKKVWPETSEPEYYNLSGDDQPEKRIIFCYVDWKEVKMTFEDEFMIKWPGKNGFKAQGTILRIH